MSSSHCLAYLNPNAAAHARLSQPVPDRPALAGILLLFDLAALSAWLNPKFAHDAAVGKAFLSAGLPLLGYVGYRLVRAAASDEPH